MSPFQIYSILLFGLTLYIPIYVFMKIRNNFNGLALFTFSIFLSVILMSTIMILRWWFYDLYLDYQISFLDLDHNGIWTPEETATWSTKEKGIYHAYFADGGRNVFAIFMFPIFSVFYSLISITIYGLYTKRKNNK